MLPVLFSVLQEHCEMTEVSPLCLLKSFCIVSTSHTSTYLPLSTRTGSWACKVIRLYVQKVKFSPVFLFQKCFTNSVFTVKLISIFIATFLSVQCYIWLKYRYNSLLNLTALCSDRSPLYECLTSKYRFVDAKAVATVTCSLLKLRQCEQHCVRALRFRK